MVEKGLRCVSGKESTLLLGGYTNLQVKTLAEDTHSRESSQKCYSLTTGNSSLLPWHLFSIVRAFPTRYFDVQKLAVVGSVGR